jgi:hypothetical protein
VMARVDRWIRAQYGWKWLPGGMLVEESPDDVGAGTLT